MPSDVSPLQIELTSTICAAIAVAVTLLRVFIRRNGFWIDDFFALLSMLCLITQLILILRFGGHLNTFNRSYLVPITSYAITWCARIAILFTIIRVRNGRVLIRSALVVVFTLIWGVSTAQLFWVCEPQRKAAAQQDKVCVLGKQVAILHIIVSVLADIAILSTALNLFRLIQDNALRHRLKAIFSTCMATSIVAIVHSVFILKDPTGWASIASIVEASTALIVCSLPMAINALFRVLRAPRLVLSSKHSHTSHTHPHPHHPHSVSTQLSSPGFPHTLQFAPSPNSDASSLLSCEREGWRGYHDAEWTPVKAAAGQVCMASDLERYGAFGAESGGGGITSVHEMYTVHVLDSDGVMIGEQVTKPLPVAQHP